MANSIKHFWKFWRIKQEGPQRWGSKWFFPVIIYWPTTTPHLYIVLYMIFCPVTMLRFTFWFNIKITEFDIISLCNVFVSLIHSSRAKFAPISQLSKLSNFQFYHVFSQFIHDLVSVSTEFTSVQTHSITENYTFWEITPIIII